VVKKVSVYTLAERRCIGVLSVNKVLFNAKSDHSIPDIDPCLGVT
jgi:hypothetical protein